MQRGARVVARILTVREFRPRRPSRRVRTLILPIRVNIESCLELIVTKDMTLRSGAEVFSVPEELAPQIPLGAP